MLDVAKTEDSGANGIVLNAFAHFFLDVDENGFNLLDFGVFHLKETNLGRLNESHEVLFVVLLLIDGFSQFLFLSQLESISFKPWFFYLLRSLISELRAFA